MEDYESFFHINPFPVDLVKIALVNSTSALCFSQENSKVFAGFKIVQETLRHKSGKIALIVSHSTSDIFCKQLCEALELQTSFTCIISDIKPRHQTSSVQITEPCHVLDWIKNENVSWSKISLLMLNIVESDVKSDDLKSIIGHVNSINSDDRPSIVGMCSLMPLSCSSQLECKLFRLESLFGTCSVSSDVVALNRYGKILQENVIFYSVKPELEEMENKLFSDIRCLLEAENDNIDDHLKMVLCQIKTLYDTTSNILKGLGVKAAEYSIKMAIRELNKMEKKCTVLKSSETIQAFKKMFCCIQSRLANDIQNSNDVSPILDIIISRLRMFKAASAKTLDPNMLSEKAYALLNYIIKCDEITSKPLTSVIICTSDTEAAALNFILKMATQQNPELSCIKSSYLSSSNIMKSNKCQDEDVHCQAITELINKGEVNVVIVSCEVENEIYLPSCNQVIRFGIPQDYLEYVRVKKIVKSGNGEVIFLQEDPQEKDNCQHNDYKKIESLLFERCEQSQFSVMDDLFWRRFQTSPLVDSCVYQDGLRLVIPVINRYCNSFPNDVFSFSRPQYECKVKELQDSYHVEATLYLPRHSPIFWPFQGVVSIRKDRATKAHLADARSKSLVLAAMYACQFLHETSELKRQGQRPIVEHFVFKNANQRCFYEVADGSWGPDGSTHRTRAYEKKRPSILSNNLPQPHASCYLYSISIAAQRKQGQCELFQEYISSKMMGLLSRNKLPQVPKFIIYKKATELEVKITEYVGNPVTLTADEYGLVQRFHFFIHDKIMKINEDPNDKTFHFDPENECFGLFVVPLTTPMEVLHSEPQGVCELHSNSSRNEPSEADTSGPKNKETCNSEVLSREITSSQSIAFDFLRQVEYELDNLQCQKHRQFQNDTEWERFRDTLVTAGYMNIPIKFIVTDIRYDMNPLSSFPDTKVAATFAEYYHQRYGIEVNHNQPLLEVKNLAKLSSCILSKYVDSKGHQRTRPSMNSRRKSKSSVFLIPELCSIHPIPLRLWQDVYFIPSILYRLESILLAEEFRQIISVNAGVGTVDWPENVPLPLLNTVQEVGEDHLINPLAKSLQKPNMACICEDDKRSSNPTSSTELSKIGNLNDKKGQEKSCIRYNCTTGMPLPVKEPSSDELLILNGPCSSVIGKSDGLPLRKEGQNLLKDSVLQQINSFRLYLDDVCCRKEGANIDLIKQQERESSHDLLSLHSSDKSNSHQQIFNDCSPCRATSSTEQISKEPLPSEPITNSRGVSTTQNITSEIRDENTQITLPTALSKLQLDNEAPSQPKHCTRTKAQPEGNILHEEPSSTLLLKALTSAGATDAFNHDRLEMYGDAFIKFAVSLRLYFSHSMLNVGKLSFVRGLMISNRQLFYLGSTVNVPSYLVNIPFQPSLNWCPYGFKVIKRIAKQDPRLRLRQDPDDFDLSDNVGNDVLRRDVDCPPLEEPQVEIDAMKHIVASDKSVADTIEAIIGAYLVVGGCSSAISVMNWLGMDVNNCSMYKQMSSLIIEQSFPEQLDSQDCLSKEELEDIETSLGYTFRNKNILFQALCHVTYPRGSSQLSCSYEQLEFVGDALLDYLVTRYFYFTHQTMSPGCLTDFRAAIVNSYSFAFLTVELGLHKYLRSLSPALFRVVNRFTAMLQDTLQKKRISDPHQVFTRVFVNPDDSNEDNDGIEVPKVMADIFESVIAAILIDTGVDVERTWLVVYKLLKSTFDHYVDNPPCSPIRQLKERFPESVTFTSSELGITGRYSCQVVVKGIGKFKGTGRSLKIARSTAAQRALAHIEKMSKKKLSE